MQLLLNIDVPDLAEGERFYAEAFGLHRGRRFSEDALELLGAQAPVYLLRKAAGSIGRARRRAITCGIGRRCTWMSSSTISTKP